MISKQMRFLMIMFIVISCAWLTVCNKSNVQEGISFTDDFEKGAAKWDFINANNIDILESGDPEHGKVLSLRPGGPAVYALIKDSDGWTNIRVEGDLFFPYSYNHYMGFIYNYNQGRRRTDFGSIFIYGPFGDDIFSLTKTYWQYLEIPPDHYTGNVVLVNPHRDSNASRILYPEYWVELKGDSGIKPGEWRHFKAEVVGPVCHFYFVDMKTPIITYDYFEYSSGRVGFKPRFAGSECWLDNITVTSIEELSYKGPALPEGRNYKPEKLLTKWDVIGPFDKRMMEIEADGYRPEKGYVSNNETFKWQPFKTDGRGCVITGRVCERFSARSLAYFHTEIESDTKKEVTLEFASSDPMLVWVNNAIIGKMPAHFFAWYDFWENPEHRSSPVKITLNPGKNHVLIYVRGGRYAGDGFYAYCRMDTPKEQEDAQKNEKKK